MSKIIVLSHQKGGVGKSTLAFNLAQNISKNASVCIVDMDPQGSISTLSEMSDFDILTVMNPLDIKELEYDFIFVDTPPYLTDFLGDLFTISNVIVIPTKAGVLDLLAIKSTLSLIEENNSITKSLIVFNMVKPNTTLTDEIKNSLEEFNAYIASTEISDLVTFSRSVLQKGVEGHHKAQKQMDNLTQEILHKLI